MDFRIENELDKFIEMDIVPEWLIEYAGCPEFSRLATDRTLDRLPWYLRDRNDGNLALLATVGGIHWRKVLKKLNGDVSQLFRYGLWVCEMISHDLDRLHEESDGKLDPDISVVLDLSDLKLSQQLPLNKFAALAKKYLPQILKLYPEILHRVCVINTPLQHIPFGT